jgi:hypothetical protein
MSLRISKFLFAPILVLGYSSVAHAQFKKKDKKEPLFLRSESGFYPSNKTLLRTMEQAMHTSMVNVGQQIEMDVLSTSYATQRIQQPKGDSQTLIVHPYKIDGVMILNEGDKRDLSQVDSSIQLLYHVNSTGFLKSIGGNEDYINASRKSGINNTQVGMNLMVYFRHAKNLYLGDSFTINHEGDPYIFSKTYILKEITSSEATFQTYQTITLHHNYDMDGYDVEQHVKGTSFGFMKVRLSDNLITYNEENLALDGYMEMVTLNIPISIKGTFKETIQEKP